MNKRIFVFFLILCATLVSVQAQEYARKWSADQGDGTFINPIVNGDFPDCDVIRVEDTYYLISTTMYHFPGATLLKSKDLVNWEYCCNPLTKIENNDAYNLLNGGAHYAQGMWASSLNYHNGKFYIYFISYGRNGYDSGRNVLLTATDPEGEWKMEYWPEHYYDAGWLFDDGENGDGYVYVACGIGDIWVNKLNGTTFSKISSTKVFSKDAHEGSHMYHIGDYYYIYITTGGYWKGQTILRSKNPMGPYEEVPYTLFQGDAIHQGGLVQTQTGEWWTIMFKDAGAIGRVPYLEPVTWKDGWPVIGNNGRDVSKGTKKYKKPDIGTPDLGAEGRKYLPTNDSFSSYTLGMQWQWNHNPQPWAWSLTERPGWMRLYSCTIADNIVNARGSLTQRILGFHPEGTASNSWLKNYGTVKLDLSGMREGDVAGLAVVQNPYSMIGVRMKDGKKYLYSQRYKFDGQNPTLQQNIDGAELTSDTIYLRALTSFGDNSCSYMYSYAPLSGYKAFGVTMSMGYTLDFFVGQRYYIYNYSTKATGGHIDIDWFTTEIKIPTDTFDALDAAMPPYEGGEVGNWNGFPFDTERFSASIYGEGSYTTRLNKTTTSKGGLAGWVYPSPWDISDAKYLIVRLYKSCNVNLELRLYDVYSIWTEPYVYKFTSTSKEAVIDLHSLITESGITIDPSHICIVAFSSDGTSEFYIKEAFLSVDGTNPATSVSEVLDEAASGSMYDLTGRKVLNPSHGVYIQNGKKYIK